MSNDSRPQDSEGGKQKKRRSSLVSLLKILIGVGLIVWLCIKIPIRETLGSIADISPLYVVVLLLISAVIILVSCMKWQLFLRARDVKVPLESLFRLYLVGYFFNNFAPSNVGGDAARSLVLGKRIGSQSTAFGTVFLERFTGFIGLISVGLITAALRPSLIAGKPMAIFLVVMGGLLVAMVAFLLFPPLQRLLLSVTRSKWLPKPLRKLEKFLDVVFFFRDKHGVLALSLLYSFSFHLFTVVNAAVICSALGIDVDVSGLAIAVPMVLLVAAVPLTPNSIGLMEGALVYFLGHLGLSPSEALAVGFVLRAKNLIVALAGWIVFMLLKVHPPKHGEAGAVFSLRKRMTREWVRACGAFTIALVSLGTLIYVDSLRVKEVTFSIEGTSLQADLYLPLARPDTAILLIHGSNVLARKLALYPAIADELSSMGYAVCNLDQRGHGGSEGPDKVLTADDLPFVDDAVRVVEALHDFKELQSCERWVILGHSFGGGVAVAAGMRSEMTDLVISISPGRRIRERFLEGDESGIRYVQKRKSRDLGLAEVMSEEAARGVLESYDIGQFRGVILPKPLLLIEGGLEPEPELSFTRDLVASMQGDVEHVMVPQADHYFGTSITIKRGEKEKAWAVTDQIILDQLVEAIDQWLKKKQK